MSSGTEFKAECDRFLPSAMNFVQWMRDAAESDAPSSPELLCRLADLQTSALRLRGDFNGVEFCDTSADRDPKAGWELASRVCRNLLVNEYCGVFDPTDGQDRESITMTIEDDIGDIYNDLLDGIELCDAGYYVNALWAWRFSYWNHWGRHLVHASAALYSYVAATGSP